jgi:hypothetical protein
VWRMVFHDVSITTETLSSATCIAGNPAGGYKRG